VPLFPGFALHRGEKVGCSTWRNTRYRLEEKASRGVGRNSAGLTGEHRAILMHSPTWVAISGGWSVSRKQFGYFRIWQQPGEIQKVLNCVQPSL